MTALRHELESHFHVGKRCCDFYESCLNALIGDLDEKLARSSRLNDVSAIYAAFWPQNMFKDQELPLLDYIFEENFLFDNGQVVILPSRIQDFANLSAELDPALVVGWGMAKGYCNRDVALDKILNVTLKSHERMYLRLDDSEGLAENHVHLGGAYGANSSFLSGIFSVTDRDDLSQELASLRRWLLELLGSVDPTEKKQAELILKKEFSGRWQSETSISPDWSGWEESKALVGRLNPFAEIRCAIATAWNRDDVDRAWLGIHFWLWVCYRRTTSRSLRIGIVLAMIVLTRERSDLVMRGAGLSRFVRSYHSRSRKLARKDLQEKMSVRRIFAHELDVAEIKIGAFDIENLIPKLTDTICRFQMEGDDIEVHARDEARLQSLSNAVERWHCCIHLFRIEKYLKNPSLILNDAKAICQKLPSRPRWNLPETILDRNPAWLNYRVGDWVRGIDVAGDENLVRIEYFAPALRLIRKAFLISDAQGRPYAPVHFSLHAGEDFADIASGVRHVDETVLYCEMAKGDRLGHALALGIDPMRWAAEKKSVTLDLDEHLDNIVWLWLRSDELGITGFDDVRKFLKGRALLLVEKLPWVDGYCGESAGKWTIEDLAHEWRLRRNSFDHWTHMSCTGTVDRNEEEALVPDAELLDKKTSRSATLFFMRQRWLRDQSLGKRIHGKLLEMPKVSVSFEMKDSALISTAGLKIKIKSLIEEKCYLKQLNLLHTLQSALYNRYALAKIQIETNPTSNVYIAAFSDYAQHPIFRWENQRIDPKSILSEKMKVTVNTDDPGVLPTSLRLEYELMKEAALSLGRTEEEVLSWISKLKLAGKEEFQDKHNGVSKFTKGSP